MYNEAFTKLELKESKSIIENVTPDMHETGFDPAKVTILAQALPFYPGYRLLDIADYDHMPPMRKFVIYKKDSGSRDVEVIDWTNAPIMRLNKKGALCLNEDTAAAYLRFYFSYTRGEHGRFSIVETIDDVNWLEEPPPAARKALGKLVKPLELLETPKDGSFKISMTMIYRDSLFSLNAKVQKDGGIQTTDEELLIEDMPVIDDTLSQ